MTKITQLPVATTISNAGVFVIVDDGITKQLPWQTLKGGGLKGETGSSSTVAGPTGPIGPSVSLRIGTVTSGTTATVTVTTSTASASIQILNFVLPQGPKGDTGNYSLPNASTSTLGGVKIGSGVDVAVDGTISVNTVTNNPYTLPYASVSTLGGVKIGSGLAVDGTGTVSVIPVTPYTLPTATDQLLGGVKIGAGIGIANGVISVTTGAFALQTATTVILGGVKIGNGINITSSGTISVSSDLSLASSLTGSVLSSSVVTSSLTSVGTLTGLTVQGNTTLKQTLEVYTSLTTATGIVVHDCSTGAIFSHTGATANWTANFTNVPTTINRVISVAVLVTQGITPRVPSAVQINGVSQSINWQGGVVPTGNANKKDLVNFTFVSPASTSTTMYTVLGSLASYG